MFRSFVIVIMLNHKHFSEYFFYYKINAYSQFLHRARCFRENNSVLSPEDFEIRKKYFIEKLNSTEFMLNHQVKIMTMIHLLHSMTQVQMKH